MQPDTRGKLMRMIERHEGFRSHPYVDSKGHLTVGYGRSLDIDGITQDEAQYLLIDDMTRCNTLAYRYIAGFSELTEARQAVIVEMIFNLGADGVLGFHAMLEAMARKDWKAAAAAMLASEWHQQVGGRAVEMAMIMETGNF